VNGGLGAPRLGAPPDGRLGTHLGALVVVVVAMGCGGAVTGARSAADVAPGPIRCAPGERLEDAALDELLLAARVIYVGESHDDAAHHAVQREVIARVHARDPSLAIGMEMFQRPFQAPLDAFVAGTLDEAGMLAATEWAERWRLDVALYRPILDFARAHRVPLVALNARREVTRGIARGGEESLAPELRAEIPPDMVRDDPEHRAMVIGLFGEHHAESMGPERLERMLLAQLVWDETMGLTVAETLAREGAPTRLVVLAGRAHVQGGLGIPRRAARRGASPFLVVLPVRGDELEQARPLCDVAWVVESRPSS
jgi:uncharacterized iron-regulated protein